MSEPSAENPAGAAPEAPKADAPPTGEAAPATEAKKAEAAPATEAKKAEAAPATEAKKAEAAPATKQEAPEPKTDDAHPSKKAAAHADGQAAPAHTKGKLLLVAWSGSPAAAWADGLSRAGYDVHHEGSQRLSAFQWASEHQPLATIIDLSTQTDDGQRLATTLRITSATAAIPVVFCHAGGESQHPTSVEAVLGRLAKL